MNFEEASEKVKKLKTRPSDGKLLQLYGLYKQATVGNCNTTEPWFYELEAKAKWDAWTSRKNMTSDDAQKKYIKYASELILNESKKK
jgi:diazepam-binding inhibitor (GABA receptor modulating acyl-CoA-binding protein)